MYALKTVNPYFVFKEWRADEALGVTDHERREQLAALADTIHTMPPDRQAFWSTHLERMIEHDESAEMRRLAVKAAGRLSSPKSLAMIEKGLDDDSPKVRMESCRALGRRGDEDSARMLASTAGTETNQDVRHAAMAALGNHQNPIAVASLKIALADRNPATRDLAVRSLRESTGKNYGDDPQVWIAALEGKPVEPQRPTRFAERVRSLF